MERHLVAIVTSSFVADGGDGYTMLGSNPDRVQIAASYEQALREYLLALGTVSADDARYAPGGEGRTVFLEAPAGTTPAEAGPDAPAPPATGGGLALAEGSPVARVVLLVIAVAVVTGAAWTRSLRSRRTPPP